MGLKKISSALLLIAGISGPQAKAESAKDGSWKAFKNKYGWEVRIPSCWAAVSFEDVPGKDNPQVRFEPGPNCTKDLSDKGWGFAVSLATQVKETPPDSRLDSQIEILRRSKKDFLRAERSIDGKPVKGLVRVSELVDGRGRYHALTLHTQCNSVNTTISASHILQRKDKKTPLSQLELPFQLEQMLTSFKCKKL